MGIDWTGDDGWSAANGNGPQPTTPLFCSDEQIAILARKDFWLLCPQDQQVAAASDGVFAADAPWVLTSESVNFQSYGVQPQFVVSISRPRGMFPGGDHLFAVDSVSGNSCTLRRLGMPLNVGQPPVPATGATAVAFECRTLNPQIDYATYRLKQFFSIDEEIFWRSSAWMYQGAEDKYRVVREATAWGTLMDAYLFEQREQSNAGDFARKAKLAKERYEAAIAAVQLYWGSISNAQSATSITSTKLSR